MAKSALPLILLAGGAFLLLGRKDDEADEPTGNAGNAGNGGNGNAGNGNGGATAAGGGGSPGLETPDVGGGAVSGEQDRSSGSLVIDGLGEYKWTAIGSQGPDQNKFVVQLWDPMLPGLKTVTGPGGVNRLWDTLAEAEAYAIEQTMLAGESISVKAVSNFTSLDASSPPVLLVPTKKGDAVVITGMPSASGWTFETVMAPGSTEDPRDFVDIMGARMADSADLKLVAYSVDGNPALADLMVRAIPPGGTEADAINLVLVEGTA